MILQTQVQNCMQKKWSPFNLAKEVLPAPDRNTLSTRAKRGNHFTFALFWSGFYVTPEITKPTINRKVKKKIPTSIRYILSLRKK